MKNLICVFMAASDKNGPPGSKLPSGSVNKVPDARSSFPSGAPRIKTKPAPKSKNEDDDSHH